MKLEICVKNDMILPSQVFFNETMVKMSRSPFMNNGKIADVIFK